MNITPIAYSVLESGSHDHAVVGLERFADYASMGLVEHAAEIARLLTGPPSLSLAEEHYLSDALDDAHRTTLFTRSARGTNWLDWAADQPTVRGLFDPASEPTESGIELARWFAEHFLLDADLIDDGLRVVAEAGGRLSQHLWYAVGQSLHADPSRRDDARGKRPAWQRRLIPLLAANVPKGSRAPWLEYALGATDVHADSDSALLLIDVLLAPIPNTSSSPSGWSAPLRVRADAGTFGYEWDKHIRPELAALAEQVLAICEHHLRAAERFLSVAGKPSLYAYRPLSGASRFSQYGRDLEPLVTVTLDAIEELSTADAARASARIDEWARSGVQILQRLALNATGSRRDLDTDDKLRFLTGRDWLWDPVIHSDVVQYLTAATGDVADGTVQGLLDDVEAGPVGVDPARAAAARLSMINLIAETTKSPVAAKRAAEYVEADPSLGRVGLAGPGEPRVGFRTDQPPMSVDDLHEALGQDPKAVATRLLSFKGADQPFDETGWWDVTQLVSATVAEYPADGQLLIEAFDHDPSIVAAVCAVWQRLNDATAAQQALSSLERLNLNVHSDAVSRMLDPSVAGAFDWSTLSAARELAERVWDALVAIPAAPIEPTQNEADTEQNDPTPGSSFDHPAGRLAAFWIHVVQHDWRAAGDDYAGFSDRTKRALDAIVAGDTVCHRLAQARLGTELRFLHAADSPWAADKLIPAFSWEDSERAARMWNDYLRWGRPDDALLDLGLEVEYRRTIDHLDRLSENATEGLVHHLVGIMLFSTSDRTALIDHFTARVPEAVRRSFIDEVSWTLETFDQATAESQWKRWMNSYWARRLQGVPLALTVAEATSLARWIHLVGRPNSVDAADHALKHRAAIPAHSQPSDIIGPDLLDDAPDLAGRVLAHLLSSTDPNEFYDHADLADTMARLRGSVDPETQRRLDEQAIRFRLPT